MAKEIYVLLDNVRSAFNTGSIFRTSDASGITKLYLCGITPYPPHTKLEKTALGALETVQWEYAPNSVEKVKELKKQGIPILSVEITDTSTDYREYTYPDKFCLVLGHELLGIQEEIQALSDAVLHIPMYGMKNSLNVAVSYGIVVYHTL